MCMLIPLYPLSYRKTNHLTSCPQVGIGGVTKILEWWGGPPIPASHRKQPNLDGMSKRGAKREAWKQKGGEEPKIAGDVAASRRRGLVSGEPASSSGPVAGVSSITRHVGSKVLPPRGESSQTGSAMDRYCGFTDD